MENFNRENLYKNPEVRDEIEAQVESMLENEKFSEKNICLAFGLEEGGLTTEELEDIRILIKYTEKRILNAVLNLEKDEVQTKEEVLLKIKEHSEYMGQFGTHDVIHGVVKYHLNTTTTTDHPNSLVPEFLLENKDTAQTIREEFPAVLWTPIGNRKPIWADLIEGNAEAVIATLEERASTGEADTIVELIRSTDTTDFASLCIAYTELVMHLAYKVEKVSVPKEEKSIWKKQYKAVQQTVRESIKTKLDQYTGDQINPSTNQGERTEELFIDQAHQIFQQYSSAKKILYNNFIDLAGPLLTKLRNKDNQ